MTSKTTKENAEKYTPNYQKCHLKQQEVNHLKNEQQQ